MSIIQYQKVVKKLAAEFIFVMLFWIKIPLDKLVIKVLEDDCSMLIYYYTLFI